LPICPHRHNGKGIGYGIATEPEHGPERCSRGHNGKEIGYGIATQHTDWYKGYLNRSQW